MTALRKARAEICTESDAEDAPFFVTFQVANDHDLIAVRRGDLNPDKVRCLTISGVVDSGASRLVLPKKLVDKRLARRRQREGRLCRWASQQTPRVGGVYVDSRAGIACMAGGVTCMCR
jgi:hypothetical protein